MSDNNAPANIHYNKLFFLSLIGLYFAQGLPSGLFAKALPAIMREHEVSLELIGLLKLLAMPWFFKFLWAPIVDQSANRRRWIFSLQLSCIPLLALLAFLPLPLLLGDLLVVMLALLLIINTLSATQDIATDGLAASTLKESELGFANTIQVAAYKMGLIIGGSSLLIAIDKIGWQNSVFLLCGLLTLSLLPLFLDKHTGTHNVKTGREKSVNILGALFSYIKQADIVLWLGVLITCKISDSLGSGMLSPMLVDKGMSLSQIGSMQTIISGVGLLGAGFGGLLYHRFHSQITFAALVGLQGIAIAAFAIIDKIGDVQSELFLVYGVAGFEQFIDGASTVFIFAYMMQFCRQGLEGSDYSLQNSIHIIGMGVASLASGFIASHFGYSQLFLSALLFTFISVLLITKLKVKHHPQIA